MIKKVYLPSVLVFLVCAVFFSLLSSCELGEGVHVMRSNKQPFLCPSGADTRFTVVTVWKNGDKEEFTFSVDPHPTPLSTKPDHIVVGLIRGWVENKLSWMQFYVYCGGSREPFYVTPRLTAKDLVKQGDRNYYYFVD